MAHDVLVWRIDTSYTGSWAGSGGGSPYTISAGQYLHIKLDDATAAITVVLSNSDTEGAAEISTLTEGPNLFFGFDGAATLLTVSPYYKFCDGTVLRAIGTNNLFPYATLSYNEGAAECAIVPVCDLEIDSIPTITDATGPLNADGTITLTASSSNGTIKYSFNPAFDYATEGQTSGLFSGLLPGEYTIYAKDAAGCQDNIVVTVPITEVYGVKYRLEFVEQITQRPHVTDILERAYSGPILIMKASGDPIHIRWAGDQNDPLKTVIPTEILMQVKQEFAGQYDDLFTQDDRLFKVQYYVDSVLYTTGFVSPQLRSEPFIFEPFDLEVTAVDGLKLLEEEDFLDASGNKYKGELSAIVIISEILKKTDLKLNIHSAINLWEQDMDTNLDPLEQAYKDMRIFEGKKCSEVLDMLLAPFWAELKQANGKWWITRVPDSVRAYDYRIFNIDGENIGDATFDPEQNLDFPTVSDRGAWRKNATLNHHRNYGYFSVRHDAGRDNNFTDEGRFEPDDIITLGSGSTTFKNWNFFLAQAGVQAGFEYVKNGESLGAALISYRSVGSTPQADNKLYSETIPLSRFSGGYLRLQFQYMVRPNYTDLPYIRLGWSLKIFNATDAIYMSPAFPPDFSRLSNSEEIINDIYCTSFGSWNQFEITARGMFPGTSEFDQMYAQVTFYSHNHYGRDFSNETALRAFSISDKEVKTGRKVMVADGTITRQYVSIASTAADSSPDIIRPDDYAGDYLWQQEKVIEFLTSNNSLVADVLIDNCSVSLFPQLTVGDETVYVEPPEAITYEELVSDFIQFNLNKEVLIGDLPIFDDTNVDVIHYNNENLIYRGWFRDVDGNPTYRWARQGIDESKKLLQILVEAYRDQFTEPCRKLTGTFNSDILWSFLNSAHEQFEGSRYKFLTMDFNCKRGDYTVDLIQIATGADGGVVNAGQFNEQQFSNAFKIS